jgi:hypothetical protein
MTSNAAQTIAAAATGATRRPEITEALNYCLTQTGCSKDQAISMVVLTLTEAGIPLRNALDAVVGPGTYQLISDTCWELCHAA